ncbi:MAG: biotin--protein ligase [Thermoprotei archaeon]|nr:MAG: biotin--protein ligase [Thermoprotei archaeon]
MNAVKVDAELKVPGGKLVRVELEVDGGLIREAKITGDFFLYPEEAIFKLEESLKGVGVDANFEDLISNLLVRMDAQLLGASPLDLANVIRKALSKMKS